jgi:hypothetical protein
VLSGLQEFFNEEKIAKLQADKRFWTLIENGVSERDLHRCSLYQVAHDTALSLRDP